MAIFIKSKSLVIAASILSLSACMMPLEGPHTEQQERMIRCDQYIGDQREACLRGEPVTIDDYQEDLKNYKKSKRKEEEESTLDKPKVKTSSDF